MVVLLREMQAALFCIEGGANYPSWIAFLKRAGYPQRAISKAEAEYAYACAVLKRRRTEAK